MHFASVRLTRHSRDLVGACRHGWRPSTWRNRRWGLEWKQEMYKGWEGAPSIPHLLTETFPSHPSHCSSLQLPLSPHDHSSERFLTLPHTLALDDDAGPSPSSSTLCDILSHSRPPDYASISKDTVLVKVSITYHPFHTPLSKHSSPSPG
ncbi:hypothetical protein DFP72DRAFT_882535 [Ephemerocybe angulata]|uniref:Uncharacterized protein n=1 Tax=Ephemerocybe angulata TaxID=980116 RepID=A0A8H6M968_9AGAR|nr:hypothetical protein DFP72DRAFT_882535 [Tulosesus angulatus]